MPVETTCNKNAVKKLLKLFFESTFYWQKTKSTSQNSSKHHRNHKTGFYRFSTAASTDVARQAKADFASSATALLLVAETLRRGEQSREAVGDKACKTENCTLECSFDKNKDVDFLAVQENKD
jgi:hypothetical protein